MATDPAARAGDDLEATLTGHLDRLDEGNDPAVLAAHLTIMHGEKLTAWQAGDLIYLSAHHRVLHPWPPPDPREAARRSQVRDILAARYGTVRPSPSPTRWLTLSWTACDDRCP